MVSHTKKKQKENDMSIITDANHADDLLLLANTPAQAESLLYSLEQVARGKGRYLNSDVF